MSWTMLSGCPSEEDDNTVNGIPEDDAWCGSVVDLGAGGGSTPYRREAGAGAMEGASAMGDAGGAAHLGLPLS